MKTVPPPFKQIRLEHQEKKRNMWYQEKTWGSLQSGAPTTGVGGEGGSRT